MRRFGAKLDNSQFADAADKTRKPREDLGLANVKLDALRRILAMPV